MRYSAHAGKAAPLAQGQSSEDSSRWKSLEVEHIEVVGQMHKWVEEILRDLDGGMAGSGRTRKHCSPAPARQVYSLKFSGGYCVCHTESEPVLLLGVPWCLADYLAQKMKALP